MKRDIKNRNKKEKKGKRKKKKRGKGEKKEKKGRFFVELFAPSTSRQQASGASEHDFM